VELALSEEESLLQSAARRFLASECPVELVREYRHRAGSELPAGLWSRMAELGWLSLWRDAGLQVAAVLLEELGAAAAPVPYLEAAVLAPAILESLDASGESASAPAGGPRMIVPALKEPGSSWFAPTASRLLQPRQAWGEPSASPFLAGQKEALPWAGAATHLLWPASIESESADGSGQPAWFLLETGAAGLVLEGSETVAEELVYRAEARGVSARPALGSKAGLMERVMAIAAVAQAAEITGLCRTMTERTVEYAKDRRQFGVAIGSFQAVQHRCVEMATDLEGMRLLVRQAAWLIDQDLPAQPQASLAKAFASEGARRTIYHGHQVHGAVGFIREHDLYLYSSRLRLLEARYGDAAFHRARAAQAFVASVLASRDPGQACRV
jgi:alkylation response protein AidB-like acyl-CoA dehydrogenase